MAVFTGKDNPQVGAIQSDFIPPKDGGEEKFPISFWNYRYLGEGMTPEETSVWADLGLTVSMAPKIHADLVGKEELLQYLDNAEKAGIKLIIWVEGLEYNNLISTGEEWYRDLFGRAYGTFRHPALYGFYAGDEPSGVENFRASWKHSPSRQGRARSRRPRTTRNSRSSSPRPTRRTVSSRRPSRSRPSRMPNR